MRDDIMKLNAINKFPIKPSKCLSKREVVPFNLEDVLQGDQPNGFYVSLEYYDEIKELMKGE